MNELKNAGIPPRFYHAKSSNQLKSYYIFGVVGSGKTYEAVGLAKTAIEDGTEVAFFSTAKLFEALRKYNPQDSSDNTMSMLRNRAVLIIDDLGKEKLTEWKYEQLFDIIDHRYGYNKTTIITSNYDLEELAERYGDNVSGQAIVSRIAEMCEQVDMGGKDRRLG